MASLALRAFCVRIKTAAAARDVEVGKIPCAIAANYSVLDFALANN